MPPQPAKNISSYFNKLPTPTKPPNTSSIPTSVTAATSSSPIKVVPSSPLTSNPASSPATTSTSQKRGFLSDAARKAIAEGVSEGNAAKKVKLDDGTATTAPKVADVFLKAASGPSTPTISALSRASSRQELKEKLANHAKGKGLLDMEVDTLGEDWLLALQNELTKPYFLTLKDFVVKEQGSKKVFPPAGDVYSWSRLCPLKDVRVVIIGQDPYHDDGQAHGLAFSVRKGMRIPPSLRNIYKEMSDEIPGFTVPKHGDLTEWAKHGVLLLNTSLTVRAHEAGSHANKGWETFTAAVLKVVTSRLSPTGESKGANGVVFMAWGAHAQKMCSGVDKNKHLLLKSVHPSPLAAMRGFFGCGHFSKANEWLEERYGPGGGVDWKSLGAEG